MAEPRACQDTRQKLDAYLSRELSPQFSGEVEHHLAGCTDCTAEFESRKQVRGQLQEAMRDIPVPEGLDARVRNALGKSRRAPRTGLWAVAAAAGVILCVMLIGTLRNRANPVEAILRKTSGRLASVLNVGLRDHLQCAVFRKHSKTPEPAEKMAEELGPRYAGIVPLVAAKLPPDFRIIEGHECSAGKRNFAHLIIIGENGKLVSVLLTRKEDGESLNGGIHQQGVDRFQVVAFESHGYLGYVISDLDAQENLQWAANLAPAMRAFLGAGAG